MTNASGVTAAPRSRQAAATIAGDRKAKAELFGVVGDRGIGQVGIDAHADQLQLGRGELLRKSLRVGLYALEIGHSLE